MRDSAFVYILAGAVAVGPIFDANARAADIARKDQHPVLAVPVNVASTSAVTVSEFRTFDTITGELRTAPLGFRSVNTLMGEG
jgi:hypothetical protein